VDWQHVDWQLLERLRDRFLKNTGGEGPYWADEVTLANYDFTFGRRIAWKWAAVLQPMLERGWEPPARRLIDWGCGTGVATRSFLAHFGTGSIEDIILWDHSPAATRFARAAIEAEHPGPSVRVADPSTAEDGPPFVLLVSHVINELDTTGLEALLALARKAEAIIWIEPGTREDSRRLLGVREQLRGVFHCHAPCPHDGPCGMLAAENARHWCHHFARPPTEAFTSRGWSLFAQRLNIDLRALPYSHLVLDRRPPPRIPDAVRIIGAPREYSGLMKILRCREDGVSEVELQKRDSKPLWKKLQKKRDPGLLAWRETEASRIAPGSFQV